MWKFITTRNFLMDQAGGDGGDGGGGGSLLGGSGGGAGGTGADDKGAEGKGAGDDGKAKGGSGGTGSDESWLATLPDDIKEDASLKLYKDVKSLAAAHIALKKHLGAEKLALPGKNATPEDWKQLFHKLGVPEKVEDYKVAFKKEAIITDDFAKNFTEKLHAFGVLPSQAQAIADWVSDMNIENTTKFTQARAAEQQKEINALKEEWGEAYAPNIARANKVWNEHLDKATAESLLKSGMGNDVRLIKLLSSIGNKLYKEDKSLEGEGGMQRLSPADAKAAANKIIADFKHPYHIKDHPNHRAAVEEVAKLFEQAASKG